MGNIFILKAADHFDDGGAFADVGKELVAEPFALAGAAHKPGDVNEIHAGVNGFLGLRLGCQGVNALVGNGDRRLVGLDGAEGIVGGLRILRLGKGVEESGFAHIGQADDADAERHDDSFLYLE